MSSVTFSGEVKVSDQGTFYIVSTPEEKKSYPGYISAREMRNLNTKAAADAIEKHKKDVIEEVKYICKEITKALPLKTHTLRLTSNKDLYPEVEPILRSLGYQTENIASDSANVYFYISFSEPSR